jgi:hypothetical protein
MNVSIYNKKELTNYKNEVEAIFEKYGTDISNLQEIRTDLGNVLEALLSYLTQCQETRKDNKPASVHSIKTYLYKIGIDNIKLIFGKDFYNENLKFSFKKITDSINNESNKLRLESKATERQNGFDFAPENYFTFAENWAKIKIVNPNDRKETKLFYQKLVGLIGLTGRRPMEIIKKGNFRKPKSYEVEPNQISKLEYCVYFDGQAKKRDIEFSGFVIELPILAEKFLQYFEEFRTAMNEKRATSALNNLRYSNLTESQLHNSTAKYVSKYTTEFNELGDFWKSEIEFNAKTMRAVYAFLTVKNQILSGFFGDEIRENFALTGLVFGFSSQEITLQMSQLLGHEDDNTIKHYINAGFDKIKFSK